MENQRYLKSEKLSILLFVLMFLMYAVVYMTKSMFSSAMAVIVEEGFMTKSQTGLINAMFWLVYAVFQVVGGFAVDKYSPYKLIMIGLAGAVLSNLVIYFNQSYSVMMVSWMFNAMIQFGVWPGIFKIVSTQTAPSIRGTAVFWMLFSTSVGLGMSMLIVSFVSHWKQNFLVSVISLLVMMVVYFFINLYLDKKMVVDEVKEDEVVRRLKVEKAPLMPLMLSSGLIAFMVLIFIRVSIDNGIKMMTPVMLMEAYDNLPAAVATRMSSVLIIFSALGTLVAGYIKRRITKNEIKGQLIFYSISLLPLIATCFVGHIHYALILIALSAAVMLVHGASPFGQTFVALRYEKYGLLGTVTGILNATASVGNIFASYIFAKMAELMPWEGVTTSWLASISICCVICVVVRPRWKRFIEE